MELNSSNQYIINIEDVINNSEITEEDLTEVYGNHITSQLIVASRKVYTIMYNAYCGWEVEQQIKELHYIINNDSTKKDGIRDAIIEYVRGALISGMDLKQYESDEKYYSSGVRDILHQNGLWIKATIEATEDLRA